MNGKRGGPGEYDDKKLEGCNCRLIEIEKVQTTYLASMRNTPVI